MSAISLQGGKVTKDSPATAPTQPEKVGKDEVREAPGHKMAQCFVNNTDLKIWDIIIHVAGKKNDPLPPPKMIDVQGSDVDNAGDSSGELGEEKPDGPDLHMRFKHGVRNADKFKLNIVFDRPFKEGESVTYTPTDEDGAAIA